MTKKKTESAIAKKTYDLHQEIIQTKSTICHSFLRLGELLFVMHRSKGYQTLGYETWNAYLGSEDVSLDRSTAHMLVTIHERLVMEHKWPAAQLGDVESRKLYMAARCLPETHQGAECPCADWVARARALSRSDMQAEVREALGGSDVVERGLSPQAYAGSTRLAFCGVCQDETDHAIEQVLRCKDCGAGQSMLE